MSVITVIPDEQTPRVPEIQEKQPVVSQEIKTFLIRNAKELQEFKDYAYTRFDAVGLAANQVQFDDYRFMVRAFALKNTQEGTWQIIIDPKITEYIGIKETKCEGCLTWKGRLVVAERSRAVRVNYYDEAGDFHCGEIYKGFDGQVWQHEINHLDGIEERIETYEFQRPKPLDIQRNDKCPCGSGKKYKHCCLLLI